MSLIYINQFNPEPQFDWNVSGTINDDDELFEFYNYGNSSADLSGWILKLIDSTSFESFESFK